MKNLSRNQWIAVSLSLAFLSYLLFSNYLVSLFNPSVSDISAEAPKKGVVVKDLSVGEGASSEPGDTLTVHYTGTLADGKVFDSSRDSDIPFSFNLGTGQVIRGWDEGLIGMRIGGKRTLTIAPEYAYGTQGVGTIPPNSTLTFEVELLDVKKPASR